MPQYRIYHLDVRGQVGASEWLDAPGDTAAIEAAAARPTTSASEAATTAVEATSKSTTTTSKATRAHWRTIAHRFRSWSLSVPTTAKTTTEAARTPAVDSAATLDVDYNFATFDAEVLGLLVSSCRGTKNWC